MGTVSLAEPEYDLPPFDGQPRFYVICATPRSGSALLCHLLHRTGRMGVPEEYLHPDAVMPALARRLGATEAGGRLSLRHYLDVVVRRRTTANGVFGLKVQLDHLRAHWGRPTLFALMRQASLVHISRRDRIAQSTSFAIATATGAWNAARGAGRIAPALPFDAALFRDAFGRIALQEFGWANFFEQNALRPIRVVYEDLVADPGPICAAICRAAGAEPPDSFPIDQVPIERQSGTTNAEWIAKVRSSMTMPPDPA